MIENNDNAVKNAIIEYVERNNVCHTAITNSRLKNNHLKQKRHKVHKDTFAQRKKRIRAHKDFVGKKPYGTPCAPQGATIQRKPYAAQGSAQARTRPGGFRKESSRKVKDPK